MTIVKRVNGIKEKYPFFFHEISLIFSLFPYLYISIYEFPNDSKIIANAILINGFLCHFSLAISLSCKNYLRLLDIFSNISFIIYINYYTKWQPYSCLMSIIFPLLWIKNINTYNIFTILQHMILIQGSGFIVLYKFDY
jgi:hypothetical protein